MMCRMLFPCKMLILLLLFIAMVPGVLFTIPYKGSRTSVLITHALLFVFLVTIMHRIMHPKIIEAHHIKGYYEFNCRA